MSPSPVPLNFLLSLPPNVASAFLPLTGLSPDHWFAASDPEGSKLGSGGGTAYLLQQAKNAQTPALRFREGLGASRKLIIHGGGHSRRLPAYGPVGKPLIPLPALRSAYGQTLDQTLLDFQKPIYADLMTRAPEQSVVMITSGDVYLRFGSALPTIPEADVVAFGMQVPAEVANHFGVFFLRRTAPASLDLFLQKPAATQIRALESTHTFLVDTGVWLLSERAVMTLMAKCGWDDNAQQFACGLPDTYELYADFGLGLGAKPQTHDPAINALTCAVVSLPEPEFYHFGTSRQLIESVSALQRAYSGAHMPGMADFYTGQDQHVQNAVFEAPIRQAANRTLWVENATIPATWRLASEHVLTGVPDNTWDLALEQGVCLDFAPIGEQEFCIRAYGIDDAFRGALEDPDTLWFGRTVGEWFARRDLEPSQAGLNANTDIQQAPLFPVLPRGVLTSGFIQWLFAEAPQPDSRYAELWRNAPRLSAQEIGERVNLTRLYRQRDQNRQRGARAMYRNHRTSIFFRLDLDATARQIATQDTKFPDLYEELRPVERMHDRMFRGAILRSRGAEGWQAQEAAAFAELRQTIIRETQMMSMLPTCHVLEDQIVWGRSPVRLDLAGGWTDTPPYCLEHGGKVVNLAVNLNGQPPVQVYAKLCKRPELVIRSIDLGVEDRIRTYEELDTFAQAGSEFALAKAALAQCGFLPRFHAEGGFASLQQQLEAFGGGIEVSLLAAVPAGSGLGTSSILASTLLGVLSELCGLNWDRYALLTRTLAVEQMLTTGGGWQDQAGGLFRSIKLVETAAGLVQQPTVRWLPSHLFTGEEAHEVNLLYYTGLTRLAKNILYEIVRGMFLNATTQLSVLQDIGANAVRTFDAIQRADRAGLCEAVQTSWTLNQRLDAGTNTPQVQGILDQVSDYLAGAKLLGAGGGGYLLMLAKDPHAATLIQRTLTENPPNAKARFVHVSLSETGLEITRS